MTIGEPAGRFGLATHVLRHGEPTGLIDPVRDRNGRRRYYAGRMTRVDRNGRRRYYAGRMTRVAVVLRAEQAGLALDDIRELLEAGDLGDRRRRLAAHREALRRRMAETQACLDLIEGALDCGHADLTTCPRFREIVADATGTT
ncbi:MerR family transcriptional regulator [Streptomyces sp. LMG1-1-1.1]